MLLEEIIATNSTDLLRDFILTVGVVSNHGNWFTSDNHNKELRVLAQSYDWLLFLTDLGITQFIEDLLLNPQASLIAARVTFVASYTGKQGRNQFTKVKIALAADTALQSYFASNRETIEGWFNVISPVNRTLGDLKRELDTLRSKNWQEILQ